MGEVINFKPRLASQKKEDLPNDLASLDLDAMMDELMNIVKECKSLAENPTDYSLMVVKVTDMIQAIAVKYDVDPKNMISDLMYILASKDIINNLPRIEEDLDE